MEEDPWKQIVGMGKMPKCKEKARRAMEMQENGTPSSSTKYAHWQRTRCRKW